MHPAAESEVEVKVKELELVKLEISLNWAKTALPLGGNIAGVTDALLSFI